MGIEISVSSIDVMMEIDWWFSHLPLVIISFSDEIVNNQTLQQIHML